ncbi:hypothetical protein [Crystallibacter crystallopoietes]|uniref:hypothetical protein n=1 Tax=Crystallibacter crystallopoietes TaxID=37928 RepID=UPI0005C1F42F|nr:hypothetical protein [Arthrobacter crystallopoietes]
MGLTSLAVLGATLASLVRLPFGAVLLLSAACQQILHLLFTALVGSGGSGLVLIPLPGEHHEELLAITSPTDEPGSTNEQAHAAMLLLYAHAGAAVLGAIIVTTWTDASRRSRAGSGVAEEDYRG